MNNRFIFASGVFIIVFLMGMIASNAFGEDPDYFRLLLIPFIGFLLIILGGTK